MAQRYEISSLDEAEAYLAHPVLGARLRECSRIVAGIGDRTVEEIFGYPDDMKFRSSMTLFVQASPGDMLDECLHIHFGGQPDQMTLSHL